jgi:hypothetical protein
MPDAGHAGVPDELFLANATTQASISRPVERRPLLLLLEGANDADFLVRISRMRCQAHASPVNLAELATQGQIVIVPFGGGISADWWNRFAPLGCPELHLYDREVEPQTAQRIQLAQRVNSRPRCQARVTAKRSLENYLHPEAIRAAGGCNLSFGDDDRLAQLLARGRLKEVHPGIPWEALSPRTRQRLSYRAKRWLNTRAVEHMTPELLADRDPAGEVQDWLRAVAALLLA